MRAWRKYAGKVLKIRDRIFSSKSRHLISHQRSNQKLKTSHPTPRNQNKKKKTHRIKNPQIKSRNSTPFHLDHIPASHQPHPSNPANSQGPLKTGHAQSLNKVKFPTRLSPCLLFRSVQQRPVLPCPPLARAFPCLHLGTRRISRPSPRPSSRARCTVEQSMEMRCTRARCGLRFDVRVFWPMVRRGRDGGRWRGCACGSGWDGIGGRDWELMRWRGIEVDLGRQGVVTAY